jgi:hypothetical protein
MSSGPKQLLFINKDSQSSSLTRSTGRERFLIGSHISQQHKKKRQQLSKAISTSRRRAKLPLENASKPSSSSIEPDELTSEEVSNQENEHASILIRQITAQGQHVDPFNSTALRINRNTFQMIQYFLFWTLPRDNVLTIEPIEKSLNYRIATVRPNEVVEKALADELHMASLLSFIACLIDGQSPGQKGLTRIWEVTNQALGMLRQRLRGDTRSDLVFDILNLAYAALYLGETLAARAHVQALRSLADSSGGYTVLTPHTLPSIMYADVCCSLPGLRQTVFDMSNHELPRDPPMTWLPVSSLYDEAQLVRMQLFHYDADPQCKEYAFAIVEMAQVLHYAHQNPELSQNAYWVMLKCLTLLSNLLANFQKEVESNRGWSAVAFPKTHTTDLVELEITRISLLLWLLLLRMVVWGRTESSEFMPPFEESLLQRYKATGLGEDIYIALSSWNMMSVPTGVISKKLGIIAPSPTAAAIATHRAAVVTKLEQRGGIRLGKFMNHLLQLEQGEWPETTNISSLALITSTTGPRRELDLSSRTLDLAYRSSEAVIPTQIKQPG